MPLAAMCVSSGSNLAARDCRCLPPVQDSRKWIPPNWRSLLPWSCGLGDACSSLDVGDTGGWKCGNILQVQPAVTSADAAPSVPSLLCTKHAFLLAA